VHVPQKDIRVAGGELEKLGGIDKRDPCLLAWHINLDLAKAEILVKPLWLPLMSFHSSSSYPAASTLCRPVFKNRWFFPKSCVFTTFNGVHTH
jgi:hypothetical protein